mmetsp:Transcript_22556/g.64026  ORF Transcript_22556/g.64026 Transcript_22556/m.64026 type:complete len:223 (+) Transcript_22556:1488-2156(+)
MARRHPGLAADLRVPLEPLLEVLQCEQVTVLGELVEAVSQSPQRRIALGEQLARALGLIKLRGFDKVGDEDGSDQLEEAGEEVDEEDQGDDPGNPMVVVALAEERPHDPRAPLDAPNHHQVQHQHTVNHAAEKPRGRLRLLNRHEALQGPVPSVAPALFQPGQGSDDACEDHGQAKGEEHLEKKHEDDATECLAQGLNHDKHRPYVTQKSQNSQCPQGMEDG